jgi:curved DNA-binding protein CbpA
MGASQSLINPTHISIYKKLLAIQNLQTRLQTIDTLFGDPSIVYSAKQAGIYATLLQYAGAVRYGGTPPPLPGETTSVNTPPPQLLPTQLQHNPTMLQRPTATQINQLSQSNQSNQSSQSSQSNQTTTLTQRGSGRPQQDHYQQVAKPKRSEKALNFFSACLRVLDIHEEVALTEEMLKGAYKSAARKAHPDKGGSKESFDSVTRAYAYLVDILKLVKGQQTKGSGDKPATLESAREARQTASSDWAMPKEPVKLNPNNLNMTVFNQMFEQTRIPDPDEDGYGDWLKDEAGAKKQTGKGSKKFSDDFNREVFNRMFEEETGAPTSTAIQRFQQPQEMILSAGFGVEIGRDRPADYTAAPNSKQQFTDLRAAYTTENTVSNQIQGIRVDNRDFNSYKAQRERAPDAYSSSEMAQLQAYETQKTRQEEQRRLRAAQEMRGAQDYFERMKQLVITEK